MKETTTHFGFKDVAVEEKQSLVKDVFDSVASKYDLMNDVLSFGAHHLWKEYTIKRSGVKRGDNVLDIAGGTGDLAYKFNSLGAQVTLADINLEMLKVGRDKMIDKGVSTINYSLANAEKLPFKDNSFDIVSIAFGLRNVTDKQSAINDFYRVLKPNGTLLILEFSKTDIAPLEKMYDAYSFHVMPKLGKYIAGDEESYQYLAESIRKHPNQETLKSMVTEAGFNSCEYHNLTGGIVALHKAIK